VPSRFTSGAYEPELVNEMSRAFEHAWADFEPRPKNERLAKWLMATAIIEAVELGTRHHEHLVRRATVALITAIKADPRALGQAAPDAGRQTSDRPTSLAKNQRGR
jgi:hypothetical protein